MMDVLYPLSAGLDVHKKLVVACVCTTPVTGHPRKEIRTFSTMTADILALSTWLTTCGVTHVAMESTGEFWKPIYQLLEDSFTLLVVNAQHIKAVPGRKTDVKDAEWIADLLRHGLLQGSFIPPQAQRDLRDLTRQRTNLVADRGTVVKRLQKVLEWSNIKLASVVSDVMGLSARAMLEAIVGGEQNAIELAGLAKGRLRKKHADLVLALEGTVRDHHRFMLAQHLAQIDFLDEQIAALDAEIVARVTATAAEPDPLTEEGAVALTNELGTTPVLPRTTSQTAPVDEPITWAEAVRIWDSIPGIGGRIAEQMVAEIGADMSRFPSAAHLASWAKLCPGNHESAGKRLSGKTGQGNRWLRSALIQAAHAAVKVKESYLGTFYRRLASRQGVKKAIMAVAHKLLVIAYTLLTKQELYQEPGPNELDARRKDQTLRRLRDRIEQLGYTVNLEPREAVAD
jgi:transposase